jgi:hypothetical protein
MRAPELREPTMNEERTGLNGVTSLQEAISRDK